MNSTLTEGQIESIAERLVDSLDRQYLSGAITTEAYDAQIAVIDAHVLELVRRNQLAGRSGT